MSLATAPPALLLLLIARYQLLALILVILRLLNEQFLVDLLGDRVETFADVQARESGGFEEGHLELGGEFLPFFGRDYFLVQKVAFVSLEMEFSWSFMKGKL